MKVHLPGKFIEKQIARYTRDVKSGRTKKVKEQKKIITISRVYGTGGRTIAEALGAELDLTVWGREIMDVLADNSYFDYQATMFESLDEKKQNVIDALVSELFGGLEKFTYFHLLPKAVYIVAQHSAIIIGRGAHLLLPDSFRVQITAPFETRVRNMVNYDGMDEKAAADWLKKADKERESYFKDLCSKLNIKKQQPDFDLMINTDRLEVPEATDIILHAFDLFQKKQAEK